MDPITPRSRVVLEVRLVADGRIEGTLEVPPATPTSFSGWLELMGLLEGVLSHPPA